jgi:hypothetical protein
MLVRGMDIETVKGRKRPAGHSETALHGIKFRKTVIMM